MAFSLISFAQDEIKYKTAFDNVEQNCDSLNKVEFCYLIRFQSIINRKFTDIVRNNYKLEKHIGDNIYLEIEIDSVGKFVINKIETKSSEIKKSLLALMNDLPKIKSSVIDKNNFEAILEFKLSEYKNESKITGSKSKEENINQQIPIFPGCEITKNMEKDKDCFMKQMNYHIIKNFKYPKKARVNNITGRALSHLIINNEGNIENFIIYGADNLLLKETLRLIKLLPKLKPAEIDGKKVSVAYAQPILFKLD